MEWLFRPKVQLGLFVNFVFVLFTVVSSTAGERASVRSQYVTTQPEPLVAPYAPLPPPASPSGATVVESGGRLNVFLTKDMTLVDKPGRTLIFAPSFSALARPAEPPAAVTLRFMILSEKDACPGACMLVINADGSRVWESAAGGASSTDWTREKIPGATTKLADGQTIQTLSAETLTTRIPFGTFVETAAARRVVLSLGPDKVELTHDQIEALRDMYRRVARPPAAEHEPAIINTF